MILGFKYWYSDIFPQRNAARMYIVWVDRDIFMSFWWRKSLLASGFPKHQSRVLWDGTNRLFKRSETLQLFKTSDKASSLPSSCVSSFGFMLTFNPFSFNKWFWTSALGISLAGCMSGPILSVSGSCNRQHRAGAVCEGRGQSSPWCEWRGCSLCSWGGYKALPLAYFPPQEEGKGSQRLLQRSFPSLHLLFLVPGSLTCSNSCCPEMDFLLHGSMPRSCSGQIPAHATGWGLGPLPLVKSWGLQAREGLLSFHECAQGGLNWSAVGRWWRETTNAAAGRLHGPLLSFGNLQAHGERQQGGMMSLAGEWGSLGNEPGGQKQPATWLFKSQ